MSEEVKVMTKVIKTAKLGLAINIIYGVYNVIVGLITPSCWFFTAGVYYLILSVVRLFVLRANQNKLKKTIRPFSGLMLMLLSIPLVGMVVLASVKDRGIDYHEITMITIALYTFTKITLASINIVKAKKNATVRVEILRNISFADAFVSIFSLQRSMLVSFDGMAENEIRIMNIATGSVVCVIVFLLGLNLVCNKKKK